MGQAPKGKGYETLTSPDRMDTARHVRTTWSEASSVRMSGQLVRLEPGWRACTCEL